MVSLPLNGHLGFFGPPASEQPLLYLFFRARNRSAGGQKELHPDIYPEVVLPIGILLYM